MKFTLKDYQADAVEDVLVNLKRARDAFRCTGERSSFSLAATTGAGKTVMAAAAIEALFWGNDNFDFEPPRQDSISWDVGSWDVGWPNRERGSWICC